MRVASSSGRTKRQQRAQQASSVHGKRRDQVESSQQEIGETEQRQQFSARGMQQIRRLHADGLLGGRHVPEDAKRHQQVRQGSGQGNPQFLHGAQPALHARQASDGEHHDLQRADLKPCSDGRVGHFMQQNAGEQPQDEGREHRRGIVSQRRNYQEQQEKDEGEMQPDGHAQQPERPHGSGRGAAIARGWTGSSQVHA